ncbi:MAG: hypothetical protein AAGK23_08845 [Pseudomonadota bacterium]
MSVSLLELSNGRVSLEFDEADIPTVALAIRTLFGEATQKRFPTAAEVRFGGANFAFQNEWKDPCLVSETPLGNQCLQAVCAWIHRETEEC